MSEAPAALELRDIVLPDPVSWAPQTVGWWIVFGIAAVVLAWATVSAVRRYRANRYRRLALARLALLERALQEDESREAALAEIPVLVKQTALAFRPRQEVASLTGDAWLLFLDRSYDGSGFTEGPGRLLPAIAYGTAAGALGREEVGTLIDLVRIWIGRHRVRV